MNGTICGAVLNIHGIGTMPNDFVAMTFDVLPELADCIKNNNKSSTTQTTVITLTPAHDQSIQGAKILITGTHGPS